LTVFTLGDALFDALSDVELADQPLATRAAGAAAAVGAAEPPHAVGDTLHIAHPELDLADLAFFADPAKSAAAIGSTDPTEALWDADDDAGVLQEIALLVGAAITVHRTAGAVLVENLVADFVSAAVSTVCGADGAVLLVGVAIAVPAHRGGHDALIAGLIADQPFVTLATLAAAAVGPT